MTKRELRLVFTIALGDGTRERGFSLGVLGADVDPAMVDAESIEELVCVGVFVPTEGVSLTELRCAVRNQHLLDWVELRDDSADIATPGDVNAAPAPVKPKRVRKPKPAP